MVEFGEKSTIDLTRFHPVTNAKGALGIITLNHDVFLCVITGSEEVATVRPGETVQKIFAVEFCAFLVLRGRPTSLIPLQSASTVPTTTMLMDRIQTPTQARSFIRMMSTMSRETERPSIPSTR